METKVRTITIKTLRVIALCLVCAGVSLAQDAAADAPTHGLMVVKLTWSRQLSSPRMRRGVWQEDMGARRSNPDSNPETTLRRPAPILENPFPAGGKLPYLYVYSLKVKNVGSKTIRGVAWDYVVNDRAGGAELNRRAIINYQNIRPGAGVTLQAVSASPPTNVVTAEGLGADEHSPFVERALIKCVLYADDSTWEHPEAQGTGCEELRRVDVSMKARKKSRR
jgi:hypothetical protein